MPAWYNFSAAAIVCSLPTRIRDIRFCNKKRKMKKRKKRKKKMNMKRKRKEKEEEEEEEEGDHAE